MKARLIFITLFCCLIASISAELTGVSIEVRRVEEVTPTQIKVKGYKYSLKSSNKEEQLKDVSLEHLLKMIPKLKNHGSMVYVDITSEYHLSSYELSKILMAMNENPYLSLVSLKANPHSRHLKK